MKTQIVLLTCLAFLVASPALAADKGKTILQGLDPVALIQGEKTMGKAELTAVHAGFKYQFSSAKHKAAFERNPAKFAVADMGNCPVSKLNLNRTIKGQPDLYSVYQGKIYLFGLPESKEVFDASPETFIKAHSKLSPALREGSGS